MFVRKGLFTCISLMSIEQLIARNHEVNHIHTECGSHHLLFKKRYGFHHKLNKCLNILSMKLDYAAVMEHSRT